MNRLQRSREVEEGDADYIQPLGNDVAVLDQKFVEDTSTHREENGFNSFWAVRASEFAKEREITAQSALLSLGGSPLQGPASKDQVLAESVIKVCSIFS